MTNKPMSSVERESVRELWVMLSNDSSVEDGSVYGDIRAELRALLDKPAEPIDPIVEVLKRCLSEGVQPTFSGGDIKHLILLLENAPAAKQQGEPSEVGMPKPDRWERMSEMRGGKWWSCANKEEAEAAVNHGWTVRPLYADRQPTGQRYSMHTVMTALERSKVSITLTSNQCYALAQSLNEDLQ